MKVLAIQKDVVRKYTNLSNLAKIPSDKENNIIYIWGLSNKVGNKNGYIFQDGSISLETNKKPLTGDLFKDIAVILYNNIATCFDTKIKVTNDNIQKIKKPIFSSWSKTLCKINDLLKHTSENLNNKEVVKKSQIGLQCFSKESVMRIQKINANLAQNKKY